MWEWCDAEGHYLGESNPVPPNLNGEYTTPGTVRTPHHRVFSDEQLAKLRGGGGVVDARDHMAIMWRAQFGAAV